MKFKSLGGFLAAVMRQHGTDAEYRILHNRRRVSVGVFQHNIPIAIHGWEEDGSTSQWMGDQIDGWRILKHSADQD